jgi:hypothetical protein
MLETSRTVKAAGVRWRTARGPRALAVLLLLASSAVWGADSPGAGAAGGDTPLLSLPTPIGDVRYTPGNGLHLGDTGFSIGGYSNVNITRDEGQPALLKLDDVSFFVSWDPTSRLHLFSELELEDLIELNDHGQSTDQNFQFTAERLYGDFTVSDWLNVRAGKFLTPVGRWNVIHAQPLVLTTSRPLATELPFDPHTTGAMLFGSLFGKNGTITYSLYGQFTDQFDPLPSSQMQDRGVGARLEYSTIGGLGVGGSYLAFKDPDGHWRHLSGADTLWQRGPLELMGEFVYETTANGPGSEWGLYLQAAEEVLPHFFLVQRYEHFAQLAPLPEANLMVLGVAYRPLPYLLLKTEYLIADHRVDESPPGLKASFAILF